MAISGQLQTLYAQGHTTLFIPVYGIGDAVLSTVAIKHCSLALGKRILVSHKNPELFENNPYVISVEGLHDMRISLAQMHELEASGFSVIYPTYWDFLKNSKGLFDLCYPQRNIIAETCAKAGVSGVVDLVPEIYLTEQEKKFGRFAASSQKQIVLMSTAVDQYKQWDKWQDLVDRLRGKHELVQIGAASDRLLAGVMDLRGRLSLRQVAGVLHNADLFLGQIGGLMHVARAVGTRSVIAYSGAEPEWFSSYPCNINVHPEFPCDLCTQPGKSPYSISCTNDYRCIRSISVDQMERATDMALANPTPLDAYAESVTSTKTSASAAYARRYSLEKESVWRRIASTFLRLKSCSSY